MFGSIADLFNLTRHPWRGSRSPAICMYHSISTEGSREWGPWQYSVTPYQFKQQIAWLSENRSVVSVEEIVSYLRDGATIPEDAVAITFDDGYNDFVTAALPVLRAYDVPCTLYVSTALMEEGRAPYEFRLGKTVLNVEELNVSTNGGEQSYRCTTEDDTRVVYNELRTLIEHRPVEERNSFLTKNGIAECPTFSIITPPDVRKLNDERLVTVGSHGHHHRPLGPLSATTIEEDVCMSLSRLSTLLGKNPRHFSFPYGSHSRTARRVIQKMGFESSVTTNSRAVRPRDWTRLFSLPRIDMSMAGSGVPPGI